MLFKKKDTYKNKSIILTNFAAQNILHNMKLDIFFTSICFFFLTIISLPAQAPNHQTPLGTNLPFLRSWGRDYPFTDGKEKETFIYLETSKKYE